MVVEKLGRYEIISELGRGAMGVVYKAVDPLIDRIVAVKTIDLNLSQAELADFEERFYREAKSAGRLNHPNIVTIYDIGKTDHTAYMAMEFLEGQQLAQLLNANIALSINKIARIVAQVADGLSYAHKNGVVHRDIKPANIMLAENGVVKITDFGIARMPTGSRTQVGLVLGSPKYMAPEQVVGEEVDGRSDVFSLGVVLYEMLTGQAPFDGDNISTIMYRILNETPAPPSSLNARVSKSLDKVVLKALAKQPQDRYQDAKELGQRLRTWIKFEGTTPHKKKASKETIDLDYPTVIPTEGDSEPNKVAMPSSVLARAEDERPLIAAGFLIGTAVVIAISLVWSTFFFKGTERVTPMATPGAVAPESPSPVAEQVQNAPAAETPQAASTVSLAPLPQPSATSMKLPDAKTNPKPVETKVASNKSASQEKISLANANEASAVTVTTPAPPTSAKRAEGGALSEAVVTFAVSPWGEVFVDGKRYGVSPPLKELKLSPGKHKVEITNSSAPPYVESFELYPDSAKKIKHSFN